MQDSLFPDFFDKASESNENSSAKSLLTQEGIVYEYITDAKCARSAVKSILKSDFPLGLDTETAKLKEFSGHPRAGLDPILSRIRLVQIDCGGGTVYIFDMFVLEREIIKPLWGLPMVAHNAVFDLKHLIYAGANPKKIGCTMLMENALSGRLRSLAGLSRRYLGWKVAKQQQVSDWSAPKLSGEQLSYAAVDVLAVHRLYQVLSDLLRRKKLAMTYMLMRDAIPAIAQMELSGIHFDVKNHVRLMDAWREKRSDAAEKLRQIIGPHINPDSPKQLSGWLKNNLDSDTLKAWPTTKTGQLKTGARTLARYPDHPLVAPLLKYKEADKMLSTFGAGYIEHINPKTGRIHANFRLGGTTTGRLSCHSPNIQNPPRDRSFRELFSAPPGRMIVVADYSQIELRIAALVSGDKNMLEIYKNGQDLHRMTAAATARVPYDKVTKDQRQAAKPVNFGLLYGQGYRGLARYAKATYGVDMSDNDARVAREAFFRTYPDLRRWQEYAAREADRTKRVVTPCGRVRDFSRESGGYRYAEALNTPIQGGAAEVLMAALARLPKLLSGIDAKLVNTVHDEIVLEVAKNDVERAKTALEKSMVDGMLAVFPLASTKNLVESKAGRNWAEAK